MAEELKRHGITFSLDLNKHPKDATNLSLINAENFKVSEDGASLVADRKLLENDTIKNTITEYYKRFKQIPFLWQYFENIDEAYVLNDGVSHNIEGFEIKIINNDTFEVKAINPYFKTTITRIAKNKYISADNPSVEFNMDWDFIFLNDEYKLTRISFNFDTLINEKLNTISINHTFSKLNELKIYDYNSYELINAIPSNDEIVLFVKNNYLCRNYNGELKLSNNKYSFINDKESDDSIYVEVINIFRYNELLDDCKIIELDSEEYINLIGDIQLPENYEGTCDVKLYESINDTSSEYKDITFLIDTGPIKEWNDARCRCIFIEHLDDVIDILHIPFVIDEKGNCDYMLKSGTTWINYGKRLELTDDIYLNFVDNGEYVTLELRSNAAGITFTIYDEADHQYWYNLQISNISLRINNRKVNVKNFDYYYGGKINGTFTYNTKNDLIIAYCESDSKYATDIECGEPLKTINLGHWDKSTDIEDGISKEVNILVNNSNLNPKTFPLCPEVTIPEIKNWSIKNGLSKKGWYHFYIRYKINNYDYTQWFNFGRAFYIDDIDTSKIFDYFAQPGSGSDKDKPDQTADVTSAFNWSFSVKCSDDTDICNKTINFDLNNLSTLYKYYQIGFICSTKIYTECKITDDIIISNNNFELNYSHCKKYDINNLIKIYSNYYNVKNIINYNNRLYISNYNTAPNLSIIPNNINYNTINKHLDDGDTTSDSKIRIIFNGVEKEITLTKNKIKAKDLFGVDRLYSYQTKTSKEKYDSGLPLMRSWIGYHIRDELKTNKETYNGSGKTLYQFTGAQTRVGDGTVKKHTDKNSTIRTGTIYKYLDDHYVKKIYLWYYEYSNVIDISDYDFYLEEDKLICSKLHNNTKLLYTQGYYENSYDDTEFITNDFIENGEIQASYKVITEDIKYDDLNDSFTLIPKQPYCFYIHYIDKYGNVTQGLPIRNKIYENIADEYHKYYYYNNKLYYRYIRAQYSVYGDNFRKFDAVIYYPIDEYNPLINTYDSEFTVKVANTEYYFDLDKCLFFVYYIDHTEINKFYDKDTLLNTIITIDGESRYVKDLLKECGAGTYYSIDLKKYSFLKNYKLDNQILINSFIKGYTNEIYLNDLYIIIPSKESNAITFNNIILPKGYVSYFISYEKLDKIQVWNGIVNKGGDDVVRLFSDALNYNDKIDINIDIDDKSNIISSVKYAIANSYKDDNFGGSASLNINYNNNADVKEYGNYLYKYPIDIYNNKNKELLRVTEVITNMSMVETTTYGFHTYNTPVIINEGYRINGANKLIKIEEANKYLDDIPFFSYSIPKQFMYVPDSSKQINNPPKIYKTILNNIKHDEPGAVFYDSYLFLPQDTIDLFKNNALDYDESCLSIYSNYNEDNINQTEFVKTIRRSVYIQDESLNNTWRLFESEAYQNIQENKGEIVRIEGIGDLLLVHTKDSLFQFDKSNLLRTEDKNIQLSQGDTFDVGYKELFTSKNGFGGLQNKDAAIVGEFGYIWYNSDFHKLYQYDAGKINILSSNIEFLLNRYKPTDCKFIDDKLNKRLIIQLQLINNQVLNLTYNYDIKSFISFYINDESKDNLINEVYNTKTKFYILEDNKVLDKFDTPNAKKLSFIINEEYSKIKRLNFIKYKLYKRINEDYNEFDANSPVEQMDFASHIIESINCKVPYSGYKLRVYNDLCNTGEIDITADLNNKNPEKPYYDLGNFIFNNLRDINSGNQIFGNFFIVEFTFEDNQTDVIEFESLEYSVSYEEN